MTPSEFDAALETARDIGVPLLAAMFVGGTAGHMHLREQARRRAVRADRGLPAARPVFERLSAWWVEQHPHARPVRSHRPARAWTDPGLWADAAAQMHTAARARLVRVRAVVAAPRPLYGAWNGAAA